MSNQQDLHGAVAREGFRSQTGHFSKFSPAKLAPRCGARAIWKSKPFKRQVLGTFLEVQTGRRMDFGTLQHTWQAQSS